MALYSRDRAAVTAHRLPIPRKQFMETRDDRYAAAERQKDSGDLAGAVSMLEAVIAAAALPTRDDPGRVRHAEA